MSIEIITEHDGSKWVSLEDAQRFAFDAAAEAMGDHWAYVADLPEHALDAIDVPFAPDHEIWKDMLRIAMRKMSDW